MTTSLPTPVEPIGYPHFHFQGHELYVEAVPLQTLVDRFKTPLYVYSQAALHANWQQYHDAAQSHNVLICYGMKANSNLAILKELVQLGAGFDIVSGGELQRVLHVGADPTKIVFSGVGKQAWEIHDALKAGVKCFNVESEAELHLISQIAVSLKKQANVSLRVNPDVSAGAHPYISTGLKENKFGIAIATAPETYRLAASLPGLHVKGVDCHIGSQITHLGPFLDALEKLLDLVESLAAMGIAIEHLDVGGGLGIPYKDETPPSPQTLIEHIYHRLHVRGHPHLELILEPGRSLIGNTGVLLTTIQFLKHTESRNFAIVDAAMNDLLRPTLYNAWHNVLPLRPRHNVGKQKYDIVGPICESGDWLAKDRSLALQQGDILLIEGTGAYGMVMASNYNTRPRPAEVYVYGNQFHRIRQRESIADIWRGESTLP